jgi:hypothetical protein
MTEHSHNFVGVGPGGLTGEALTAAEETFGLGFVKIHVTLPAGSQPAGEYMWAKPLVCDHAKHAKHEFPAFKIENIPFQQDVGFTLEAIVEAEPVDGERVWEFRRVVDPGPWRQVWFGTINPRGGEVLDAIVAQHPEGYLWKYEAMHTCSFVAVARGTERMEELKDTLSDLCAAEIVAFYWDDEGVGGMADSVAAEMKGD